MYQLLEKRKWATSLCHCDPESCILAHILPCHIYAKIYKDCYLFYFIYYGIFSISLYNVYYWLDYINKNRCPNLETEYCIGLGENCSQYYMLVNGIPSKCIFDDFNICVHSERDCFINYTKINMWLSLLGSACYFILLILHSFSREKVKKDYNLESNYDVCAVTICSPCGLAQNYRELHLTYDV
jgi:Cys-rich protein (TIGR01571 family)